MAISVGGAFGGALTLLTSADPEGIPVDFDLAGDNLGGCALPGEVPDDLAPDLPGEVPDDDVAGVCFFGGDFASGVINPTALSKLFFAPSPVLATPLLAFPVLFAVAGLGFFATFGTTCSY